MGGCTYISVHDHGASIALQKPQQDLHLAVRQPLRPSSSEDVREFQPEPLEAVQPISLFRLPRKHPIRSSLHQRNHHILPPPPRIPLSPRYKPLLPDDTQLLERPPQRLAHDVRRDSGGQPPGGVVYRVFGGEEFRAGEERFLDAELVLAKSR